MTIFFAPFSAVAVSLAQDLFEIAAPAGCPIAINQIVLGQYSDFGDAQAEILSVQIIRGHTVSGSGGGTVTPVNRNGLSTATSGATVKTNNTTVATTSGVTTYSDTFNVAAGWSYDPPDGTDGIPDERIVLAAGDRLVVRITAPADALTMNGTLVFEEPYFPR